MLSSIRKQQDSAEGVELTFLTSTKLDPLLLKYCIDTSHFVLMKLTEIEVSRNNVNLRLPASLHLEFNSLTSVFPISFFLTLKEKPGIKAS